VTTNREATGDCYEAAVKIMLLDTPNPNLRLVHGEVAGQGPLEGVTLGHAWVEDGDVVIDNTNGRNITMPKVVYYAIGRIDQINNFHVYTTEEARTKVLSFLHYGPWDLAVKEGEEDA